jgi:hypothetical protein
MPGRRRDGKWIALASVAGLTAAGCTIAPRDFFASGDPAPVVRARALGMGRALPEPSVVPTLIARLDDPDAVVRMTAHEELKRRTGQDFGYVPWAEPTERGPAVAAWRAWWRGRQAELASVGSGEGVVRAWYVPEPPRRGLFGRQRGRPRRLQR